MKAIRVILLIVNLLLIAGLLLTTVAGAVSPSRMMLPSLLAYGYLPMLGANVLMVVVWALMKRWEALLSVAAIAVRWSMVGLFFQVGGTQKVPPRAEHPMMVTVMSYNVHQFQGPEDRPTRSDSNARGFLSIVEEHGPDVLCLQEYAAPKTVRVTDSLVLMGYNHYYGAHTTGSGVPYGTVVFSRLPITYVSRLDNKKVLVEILKEDRRLRVCSIHMDSYRFDATDREEIDRMRHGEVQESSRRTLEKVRETILSHQREWEQALRPVVQGSTVPLVLAGDMNDIPNSWLYSQISKELTDSYREKGFGFVTTYNGGDEQLLPIGSGWLPKFRIDMVFHNEGLRTLSYRRIKTRVSDHYPVVVAVEVKD